MASFSLAGKSNKVNTFLDQLGKQQFYPTFVNVESGWMRWSGSHSSKKKWWWRFLSLSFWTMRLFFLLVVVLSVWPRAVHRALLFASETWVCEWVLVSWRGELVSWFQLVSVVCESWVCGEWCCVAVCFVTRAVREWILQVKLSYISYFPRHAIKHNWHNRNDLVNDLLNGNLNGCDYDSFVLHVVLISQCVIMMFNIILCFL